MMFGAAAANVANYTCASIALVILITRLGLYRWSHRSIDPTFFLVLTSILIVASRLVINHFYLEYGTANDALNNDDYFNTHKMYLIKTGTILSLVSRILLLTLLWIQVSILLLWYQQLIFGIEWIGRLIKLCWVVAALTYVAGVLSTFLECRPFHRYWQLDPSPGHCIRAYVQLLVQGISNIVLDLMLLTIAFPLMTVSNRTLSQHLRVGTVFLIGTFCIVVTILRVTAIFAQKSAQPTRSLWASIQVAVAVFVANVPSIYGSIKVTKRKKSEPMIRRLSRADDPLTPSITTSPSAMSPVHTLIDKIRSHQHKEIL